MSAHRLHACPSCHCLDDEHDAPVIIDRRAPGAALVLELDRIVAEEVRAKMAATVARRRAEVEVG